MLSTNVMIGLLCLFGNTIVLAEGSRVDSFLGGIDVESSIDEARQRYDNFISKLTDLDENVKILADQLGQPDEGLGELDDQLSIIIDKLSAYRHLVLDETDTVDFRKLIEKYNSQEIRDTLTIADAGQRLIELGDIWDASGIGGLPGIADFLATLFNCQLQLQELIFNAKLTVAKMSMLKGVLLNMGNPQDDATASENDNNELEVILRDISGMVSFTKELKTAYETFYSGLESVQLQIEGQP